MGAVSIRPDFSSSCCAVVHRMQEGHLSAHVSFRPRVPHLLFPPPSSPSPPPSSPLPLLHHHHHQSTNTSNGHTAVVTEGLCLLWSSMAPVTSVRRWPWSWRRLSTTAHSPREGPREVEVHEKHHAPRGPKTPPPGKRPGVLTESEAQEAVVATTPGHSGCAVLRAPEGGGGGGGGGEEEG